MKYLLITLITMTGLFAQQPAFFDFTPEGTSMTSSPYAIGYIYILVGDVLELSEITVFLFFTHSQSTQSTCGREAAVLQQGPAA